MYIYPPIKGLSKKRKKLKIFGGKAFLVKFAHDTSIGVSLCGILFGAGDLGEGATILGIRTH